MNHPGADVVPGQPMCGQIPVHIAGHVLLDKVREVWREPQLETIRTGVPAHDVQRFGVEAAARIENGAAQWAASAPRESHQTKSVT